MLVLHVITRGVSRSPCQTIPSLRTAKGPVKTAQELTFPSPLIWFLHEREGGGVLLGCELFNHPKPKEVDDGLVGLASGGSTRGRNPPLVKSAKECLPRTHAVSCHGRRPGA